MKAQALSLRMIYSSSNLSTRRKKRYDIRLSTGRFLILYTLDVLLSPSVYFCCIVSFFKRTVKFALFYNVLFVAIMFKYELMFQNKIVSTFLISRLPNKRGQGPERRRGGGVHTAPPPYPSRRREEPSGW